MTETGQWHRGNRPWAGCDRRALQWPGVRYPGCCPLYVWIPLTCVRSRLVHGVWPSLIYSDMHHPIHCLLNVSRVIEHISKAHVFPLVLSVAPQLQQELIGAQHTLSAALQQLAALRDELATAQQQGREHQLAAAAAEAEAAAQQQSGGRGEEVGRLVEERDAAVRLAEELHQEVRRGVG